MSRTRVRHLGALVVVALAAGAIAARADDTARHPAPRVVVRPFAMPPLASVRVLPKGVVCVPPSASAPAGGPPSQALLGAFAILRRPRRPEDALPDDALAALRRYGVSPSAPEAARLLRTTPSGGRAWVVPVPDVGFGFPFRCRPLARHAAREGLAVVATGDAASGGRGALADLVGGRAPVTTDSCAGPNHDLLSVSGIVPDGVLAVFLTAPDGTAVRTDVKDNGFEFLVPHPRVPQQRYVVWTGGDGTPHVQPVATFGAPPARACSAISKVQAKVPRVPVGQRLAACAVGPVLASPIPNASSRRARIPRPAIPLPVPAAACPPIPAVLTAPSAVPPRPKAVRKHRCRTPAGGRRVASLGWQLPAHSSCSLCWP